MEDPTNRRPSPRDAWRSLALEEYRALRAEVVASLSAQQQILGFGAATLGLVIGPGLGLWRPSTGELPFLIVFGCFVPVLSAIVVVIWFGEVLRMVRAGDTVARIEEKLNHDWQTEGWPSPAFTWESELRKGRPSVRRFVINFVGVIFAFGAIAFTSAVLAVLRDREDKQLHEWTRELLGIAVAVALGAGVYMWLAWHRERKAMCERRAASGEPFGSGPAWR